MTERRPHAAGIFLLKIRRFTKIVNGEYPTRSFEELNEVREETRFTTEAYTCTMKEKIAVSTKKFVNFSKTAH